MRGLGQIAELCEIARPGIALVTSSGRSISSSSARSRRRAGERGGDRRAAARWDRGGPGRRAELEPYLGRTDIEIRRFDRPRSSGRAATSGVPARRRRGRRSTLPFTARHMAENTLAALTAYEALGCHSSARRRRRRDRALALARRGAAAAGRRFRRQRRVQRQPDLDAGGAARSPARAGGRRRVAILGEMAELGADAPSATTSEVGALLAELGIEVVVAVGEPRPAYLDAGRRASALDPGRAMAFDEVADILQPGRRDPRQGVPRGRARRHPGVDRETG